jgi:hypothetical protein
MPLPEQLETQLRTYQFVPLKEENYVTVFNDESVKEISQCIAQNPNWGKDSDHPSLYVESEGISDSGAINFLDIRPPEKNITSLSIMITQLGDNFIKELSNRIKLNVPYRALSIGGMNITGEGLITFAKALSTNSSIKTLLLFFDFSKIEPETLINYLIILSKNTSIEDFEFMGGRMHTYEFEGNKELGEFFKDVLNNIARRNTLLAKIDNPVAKINELNKFTKEFKQNLKAYGLSLDFDSDKLFDDLLPVPSLLSQTIFKVNDAVSKGKIAKEQLEEIPEDLIDEIKKGNKPL